MMSCKTSQSQFINNYSTISTESLCRNYIDDFNLTGEQEIKSIQEQLYIRLLKEEVFNRSLDLKRCAKQIDDQNELITHNLTKVAAAIFIAILINEAVSDSDFNNTSIEDVQSLSYDDLKERYKRSVLLASRRGITSNQVARPNYAVPIRTSITQSTQVKSITSASAGFTLPSATSQISERSQVSNTIRLVKPDTNVRADIGSSNNCSSDFNCGLGMKCVKAPLETYGVCLQEVDRYDLPTYPDKDPSSILPNMNLNGQCTFNTDCSVGYSCDTKLKVCVK
jgi:hypothetical protein